MVYRFKKHEIEVYDSIQNLPVLRFQKYNKYQMIASEIGNDFNDYDKRTQKITAFLKKGLIEDAVQELMNRRQTVFNAFSEFTPTGRAFATLVHRIDDIHYTKYAPDDLDSILVHLNNIGFDVNSMVTALVEVKKKSKPNALSIFLNIFRKTQTASKPL